MHRARNHAAALDRARWLDELAHAIVQAQRLTWRLGVVEGDSQEARTLYARLEAAQSEVESLRFGDWVDVPTEIDPNWLETILAGSGRLSEGSKI